MTRRKAFSYSNILLFVFIIIIIGSFWKYQSTNSKKISTFSPTPTNSVVQLTQPVVSSNPTATCHSNGVLPDPACTPGSIDPAVTQANIQQTICISGYSKTVRPSSGYTNKLKVQQIAEYGFTDTSLHDYEEDHLISLELGGNPTDPKNLWPEPGNSPNPKDKIENLCHKKVCDGEIQLAEAQKEIATDWQTACQ
ncbi:MAG TPA: hypothetical protein VLF89_05940 [Candidatus Saccharimonadales bacterium]|nr:hypothetical protein [Candidatus Saccharimonadales bacterium]